MKINWISNHPNYYNDFLFKEIASKVPLKIYFLNKVLISHPWKTVMADGFDKVYATNFLSHLTLLLKFLFSKKTDLCICGGWNYKIYILIITLMTLLKKKVVIWTDTPNIYIKRTGLKQQIRNKWFEFLFNKNNKTFFFATGTIGTNNMILMGCPVEKVFNFPFVTNTNFFQPLVKPSYLDGLIFLSSGRLINSHKGYNVALHAFLKLKKNNYQFKYYIAGEGEDRQIIEKFIIDNELENNIFLLGWLESNDIINFYNRGHILVHSSYFDPYPNSVLEGMACGLVVVGSDFAGSCVDRIKDGINGFIHESGNSESLYLKLKACFDAVSNRQLAELSKQARITSEKWTPKHNIDIISHVLSI